MKKNKIYINTLVILVLAFLALNFVYPKILNFSFFSEKPFKLGLDLKGGTHLVYEADLKDIKERDRTELMDGLRDVIEKRINFFGVAEPVVQVQKNRLIIELAGVIDPAQAIKEIGRTPFLEFREEKNNYNEILKRNQQLAEEGKKEFEDPFKSTPLTGRYLKRADVAFDQMTSEPTVLLEFNSEGAKIFEELTARNIGKILAIYIDNVPISTPVVQEKIVGGKARITGHFTIKEAKELARNLNAGALPVPIKIISQQNVGPILGRVSLEKSLKAGLFGFLAVILFLIIFYRLPGLIASIALGIYIIFMLTLFKLIPVTLTLAGIAGFILSIGMAVDANILIFSRMREEMKVKDNFTSVLEEGFRRAWPSIRDGNLTTLIVSGVLFIWGTGFVKGFALTLSLGVMMSMFSAIFITKNFLSLFIQTRIGKMRWLWR